MSNLDAGSHHNAIWKCPLCGCGAIPPSTWETPRDAPYPRSSGILCSVQHDIEGEPRGCGAIIVYTFDSETAAPMVETRKRDDDVDVQIDVDAQIAWETDALQRSGRPGYAAPRAQLAFIDARG